MVMMQTPNVNLDGLEVRCWWQHRGQLLGKRREAGLGGEMNFAVARNVAQSQRGLLWSFGFGSSHVVPLK